MDLNTSELLGPPWHTLFHGCVREAIAAAIPSQGSVRRIPTLGSVPFDMSWMITKVAWVQSNSGQSMRWERSTVARGYIRWTGCRPSRPRLWSSATISSESVNFHS